MEHDTLQRKFPVVPRPAANMVFRARINLFYYSLTRRGFGIDGRTGYYIAEKDCLDSKTPILDIQHNLNKAHGDVCRDKMPNWTTWSCPANCIATTPKSKPPYCIDLASGGPCRIKAPVLCLDGKECLFINE